MPFIYSKAEIPVHSEIYRGHIIGTSLKNIEKKNPISGHEWTEKEATRSFDVSVLDQSETPTRPATGWSKQKFQSVASAKKEVDSQIRLSEQVSIFRYKDNVQPDGTHYQKIWHQYAENLLANTNAGPTAKLNLKESLIAHGWSDVAHGIGLYSSPQYGSIVIDMNPWNESYEDNSVRMSSSINSPYDDFIDLIKEYSDIDSSIIRYIEKYQSVINKEAVIAFGPLFSAHVCKARFSSQAEYDYHSASYMSPRAANSYESSYSGSVIEHGDFHVTLDLGSEKFVDCNKVDLDRVPAVGESVSIDYQKGRGKVTEQTIARKSIRP